MQDGFVRIGDWSLHLGNQRLSDGRAERRLNPKEFDVLLHLAEAAPDMVASEALMQRSWPQSVVGDGALYQVIHRLRRALDRGDRSDRHIETLAKRGYRILPPVVFDASTRPPAQAPRHDREGGKDRAARGSSARDQAVSMAILPLQHQPCGSAEAAFSAGLAENLINRLCRVEAFQIASRTSAFHTRSAATSTGAIASRLGVRYVLEGSVRQAGRRLRVYLQLIDTDLGDFAVWAGQFTPSAGDPFAAQDDIARQVECALTGHLTPTPRGRG